MDKEGIIIGCLLADLPSAVYENERVIQLKTSQIEMNPFFIFYMCTLLLHSLLLCKIIPTVAERAQCATTSENM